MICIPTYTHPAQALKQRVVKAGMLELYNYYDWCSYMHPAQTPPIMLQAYTNDASSLQQSCFQVCIDYALSLYQ
jgi:hypothetical protein